jgi:hypothetical protein
VLIILKVSSFKAGTIDRTMSPIVKCAEAIKDRTAQEVLSDGFETVLFDELSSNTSGISTSSSLVSQNDYFVNKTLKVIRNGHWEELSQIVSASPKVCAARFSTVESSKNFLIHETCKADPPVWILKKIASVSKEAITKKGHGGYLPLHFACANSASADVLAFLIGEFPGSIHMVESTDRMLPLHFASKFGISEDAMMVLLSSFPEATMVKDAFGRTPMDFAKSQSNPPLRNATISYLERGSWLCSSSAIARHWAGLAHNRKLEELEQDMESAISHLEEEHKEERTKHEKTMLDLCNVVESKGKDIDSLVQMMDTQKAQLVDDVNREYQTAVSLRKDLEANEDELKDTMQKVKDVELTFGLKICELEALNEESSAKANTKFEAEKKETAKQITSLQQENNAMMAQTSKQTSKIEDLQRRVDTQDSAFDQSLKTLTDQIEALQFVLGDTKNALEESNTRLVKATIKNLNLTSMLKEKEANGSKAAEEVDSLRNEVEYLCSLMTSIRHLTSAVPAVSGNQGSHQTPRDFWREVDRHSKSTIETNPVKQVVSKETDKHTQSTIQKNRVKQVVRIYEKNLVNDVPMDESRADSIIVDSSEPLAAETRE